MAGRLRFATLEIPLPAFGPAVGRSSNQRQAPVEYGDSYRIVSAVAPSHSAAILVFRTDTPDANIPYTKTRNPKWLLCGSSLPNNETETVTAHGHVRFYRASHIAQLGLSCNSCSSDTIAVRFCRVLQASFLAWGHDQGAATTLEYVHEAIDAEYLNLGL